MHRGCDEGLLSEADAPFYALDGVVPLYYPLTEVLCHCHAEVLPLTFDCVVRDLVLFLVQDPGRVVLLPRPSSVNDGRVSFVPRRSRPVVLVPRRSWVKRGRAILSARARPVVVLRKHSLRTAK